MAGKIISNVTIPDNNRSSFTFPQIPVNSKLLLEISKPYTAWRTYSSAFTRTICRYLCYNLGVSSSIQIWKRREAKKSGGKSSMRMDLMKMTELGIKSICHQHPGHYFHAYEYHTVDARDNFVVRVSRGRGHLVQTTSGPGNLLLYLCIF